MKAVIQRVTEAKVEVESKTVSQIGVGLLTLLAIESGDTDEHLIKLIDRILHLRVFEDDMGKMNRSLIDIAGQHLIVSQFTLAADCTSGRRPSFGNAAPLEVAVRMYQKAIDVSRNLGVMTFGGQFRAEMKVSLVNQGPATFILE